MLSEVQKVLPLLSPLSQAFAAAQETVNEVRGKVGPQQINMMKLKIKLAFLWFNLLVGLIYR